jgi:hypothetical protein
MPATHFPSDIRRVRFNGDLYTFQQGNTEVIIGESASQLSASRSSNSSKDQFSLHQKVDVPPQFINFFRSEPVIITYQDFGKDNQYQSAAKALAQNLGSLQLRGLRAQGVNLPVIPLSIYQENRYPLHRLIVIGAEDTIKEVIVKNNNDYPISTNSNAVVIDHQPTPLPKHARNTLAYGMIYPAKHNKTIALALALTANDAKGLHTLAQHYLSATSLYHEADLHIWAKEDDNYHLATTHTFDSFWGSITEPSTTLAIPDEPRLVWEHFLRELLIEECYLSEMAIHALTDPTIPTPTILTPKSLTQFIPNRYFAVVKLTRKTPQIIAERLLQEYMTKENKQGLSREKSILVDVEALHRLSPVEQAKLDYTLVPFSLHEMMLRRFDSNATAFGKELIRFENIL